MNSKLIIGIALIVLVGVGAFLYLGKNKKQPANTMQQNSTNQTASPTSAPSTTSKNAVQIQNFAFSSASITVKVGDIVTWTNQDSAGHSATADDSSFDTGVLDQGKSGTATFQKAGTFTYHCSVHPNMKGTVVVTQ